MSGDIGLSRSLRVVLSGLTAMAALLFASACATAKVAVRPGDPQAWRAYWLAQYEERLALPELPEEKPDIGGGRTVLLVPGMTIAEEFFAPMAERLRRDGFSPVLYEDPDLLTAGVELAARRLAAKVEEIRAQTGEERIHIVAECVGGVTARYYVQMLGGGERVEQLVTFVSPHQGSSPAVLAAWTTHWQGLHDVRSESALVRALREAPLPQGVTFTSLYSCRDIFMWPDETSRVEGAINVEFCDYELGHFDGFWDEKVYERILTALVGESGAAPVRY